MAQALSQRQWRAVVMHFRGCSGQPNRRPRGYHSGETSDLAYVVDRLHRRSPGFGLAVIGYSLGGNVLLKWLGENATPAVRCAAAVSVPFELEKSARRLSQGLSRLYQWRLLHSLKNAVQTKARSVPLPVDLAAVAKARNFQEFDDRLTAPLHGFRNAQDYYRRASSRDVLKTIRTPTLIVHATDDPFLSPDGIPNQHELSETVSLELSHHGGHVGFVTGAPWRPRYWLEQRLTDFLTLSFPH